MGFNSVARGGVASSADGAADIYAAGGNSRQGVKAEMSARLWQTAKVQEKQAETIQAGMFENV